VYYPDPKALRRKKTFGARRKVQGPKGPNDWLNADSGGMVLGIV